MDKNALKKYAVWARRELISRVSQKALQYGISEKDCGEANVDSVNGKVLTPNEKSQRNSLIEKIKSVGYQEAMEEAAYTWFNRFTALRYMEVNGYLPSHVRVFTDESNNFKPQIIDEAIHLDIEGLDMEKVYAFKEANDTEELYKYLIITQCNAFGEILPGMFSSITDFTILLFPDNVLREGSVLEQMISIIPEEDWKDQVQIIGWLYQYYISEKHNEVINVHTKSAVKKEDLPAATQIFTTDWVVKYMVDNSLGKIWNISHDSVIEGLDYYLPSKESISNSQNNPIDIKFIDPCMGSGHILVYAFDVFMGIYRSCGYTEKDAVQNIVKYNLWGLELDKRAYQLAYFAIMMKARQYDRRFLSKGITPNLTHFQDLPQLNYSVLDEPLKSFVEQFKDADTFGSLINLCHKNEYEELFTDYNGNIWIDVPHMDHLKMLYTVLTQKYDVVCTNPPYLNKYNSKLEAFINKNYLEAKADLYSAFIVRNLSLCTNDGFVSMMTPHGWMFTKSFEKLRKKIITEKSISTLVHMAKGAFYSEATVDICSFVLRNKNEKIPGRYVRLEKFRGDMDVQKNSFLEAIHSNQCDYIYECSSEQFYRIDGIPFSYWATENIYSFFENGTPLSKVSPPRQGMATTNNNKFLRLWHEVQFDRIGFGMKSEDESAESGKKFFPYNKGGEHRKWYGNNYYVVNFGDHGKEVCDYIDVACAPKFNHKNRVINREYYFRECITWADISSDFSCRYCPQGFIFDIKGSSGFPPKEKILFILGLLNSCVTQPIIDFLNPTITTQVGDMSRIPVLYEHSDEIEIIVKECIDFSRIYWDSFEISWDFKKHPFICGVHTIKEAFEQWTQECDERFTKLKTNEEELNRIFIDIYGLQDDLTPNVNDDDVTVRPAELQRDVKSFISYAVGCMFGRYSLDTEGLAYAGGEWEESKYKSFSADKDNIIPICDNEYFDDDLTGLFVQFVKTVFGEDTLEENLKFIADALGGKGNPRTVIRNYFLNGFYADHCKTYQKRPIYWLFDSGKKNGFKALIYMHRYQPDTIARLRTDYVHEQQSRYRTAIADIEKRISGASGSEAVKLNKELEKLTAQAEELITYEEMIHHLADQMIKIDLDDGVKHNYEIFKDVLAKIK